MSLSHFACMNDIYNVFERNTEFISKKHAGLNPAMGRIGLITDIFNHMRDSKFDDVRLQCITEHNGRMNVYYEGGDYELFKCIALIMDESVKYCPTCGFELERDQYKGMAGKCNHNEEDIIPSTPAQAVELDRRMNRITRACVKEFDY